MKNKKITVLALIVIVYILFFFSVLKKESGSISCTSPVFELSGQVFHEELTGLDFIGMAAGCFLRDTHEKGEAQVKVAVEPFFLSSTEVTVGAFKKFIQDTGYKTTAEKKNFSWIFSGATGKWEKKMGLSWENPGFKQTDLHPVVHVSFYDAMAFCRWLSGKYKSKKFRLPSESEWEFAAKEGGGNDSYWDSMQDSQCIWSNGADLTASDVYKGWVVSRCRDGYVYTSPAKSFAPSSSGFYDMLGNVWEWCDTVYMPNILQKNKKVDGNDSEIVIKGGSFYSKPEYLKFSSRDWLKSPLKRGYDIGFRVAMDKVL